MIPRGPDDFDAHQDAVARWMGYADADGMNRDHDRLHAALAAWLGAPSHALRKARGLTLTREEEALAAMEEDAVLHVQRYMRHAEVELPT